MRYTIFLVMLMSFLLHGCAEKIKSDPKYASYMRIGATLQQAGQAQEARYFYAKAEQMQPTSVEPLKSLAELAKTSGDIEAAAAYNQKIIKIDAENVTANKELMKYYIQHRDAQHAVKHITPLVKRNKPEADILNGIAVLMDQCAEYDVAESCYRQALEIAPSSDKTKRNLALSLVYAKKFRDAELAYQKLLTENPSDNDIKAQYLTLYKLNRAKNFHTFSSLLDQLSSSRGQKFSKIAATDVKNFQKYCLKSNT